MLATADSYLLAEGDTIRDNALVIAYVSPKLMRAVYVRDRPDCTFQLKTGTYHVQDWIGKAYGCTVYPRKYKDGVQPLFLLSPTPELWTRVLSHRTQILYLADISLICTLLELKPGSFVLESGTGSGSLTHALARAVAPSGHVYTFEFHQDRCIVATEEFKQNGIADITTIEQRDVQSMGFPEQLYSSAHGVFLDLPEPWKAVKSAVACLIAGHCLVTFSPCIEQVQRTCDAIRETEEMIDIRMMECIAEEYRVKTEDLATNLKAYHQQNLLPSRESQSKIKRKETEDDDQELADDRFETGESACETVPNTRMVYTKGHTGYLVVARKFAGTK